MIDCFHPFITQLNSINHFEWVKLTPKRMRIEWWINQCAKRKRVKRNLLSDEWSESWNKWWNEALRFAASWCAPSFITLHYIPFHEFLYASSKSQLKLKWINWMAWAFNWFKLISNWRIALYILLHQHPSSQSTKYLFDFDLRLFPQHRYTYCYNNICCSFKFFRSIYSHFRI